MKALYVASWESMGGKTTLCVGIGESLRNGGKKVGYLKPLMAPSDPVGEDVRFVRESLSLEESVEALCPVAADVKAAYDRVAAGKDMVLVEGWGGLAVGEETGKAAYEMVQTIDAKVILIMRCLDGSSWMRISPAVRGFGENLLGVVINEVPAGRIQSVRSAAVLAFEKQGIRLLGVLPEERALLGVSLAELAKGLEATVVCCEASMDKFVENVMVGAMTPDSGTDYFSRKDNKVVVMRGDREDMQIAALNTSTNGLILTGDAPPLPRVIYFAEQKAIPVLTTGRDTLSALDTVEKTILQARATHNAKPEAMAEIVTKHLDLQTLLDGVGLAS